jgi:hypothetical protein
MTDVLNLPPQPAPAEWLIGASVGQGATQWTAVCALHRIESYDTATPARIEVIHLERFRGFGAAQTLVKKVGRIWPQLEQRDYARQVEHRHNVIAGRREHLGLMDWETPFIRVAGDITATGPYGLEPLKRAGYAPIGIVLHSGDAVSQPGGNLYRIPKRDVAGVLGTLLGEGRLRSTDSLRDARTLQTELENFSTKVNIAAGADSYAEEGWRERETDDLVLAVGVACWLGEHRSRPRLDPALISAWSDGLY